MDKIVSSHDLIEELKTLPKQQRFKTGFEGLDSLTTGFREGDLVILSGLSGTGKTQLAVSIVKSMAEKGIKSLFFSYEISTQELFERFREEIPVFYLPRVNTSSAPEWIEKKIIEAKQKFDTKIVFIDHLHYLVDTTTARHRNSSEIIGSLVREFKQLARRQRVIIVLLCHVRKISSEDGRPTIADLKDSSAIGQEADIVMLIHRTGPKRGKKKKSLEEEAAEQDGVILMANDAWLYLDKVRHHGGQLGRIKLTFNENGFYEEE